MQRDLWFRRTKYAGLDDLLRLTQAARPGLAAGIAGAMAAPEGAALGYAARTALPALLASTSGGTLGRTLLGGKGELAGRIIGTLLGGYSGKRWADRAYDADMHTHLREYSRRQQEEMQRAREEAEKTSAAGVPPARPMSGWTAAGLSGAAAGLGAYALSGRDERGEDHSVRNALLAAAPAAVAGGLMWGARRPIARNISRFGRQQDWLSDETKNRLKTWAGSVSKPPAPTQSAQVATQP